MEGRTVGAVGIGPMRRRDAWRHEQIFCLAPSGKSPLRTCAILSHREGRLAIATNAGQGAVDADPLARRARVLADGEVVWA